MRVIGGTAQTGHVITAMQSTDFGISVEVPAYNNKLLSPCAAHARYSLKMFQRMLSMLAHSQCCAVCRPCSQSSRREHEVGIIKGCRCCSGRHSHCSRQDSSGRQVGTQQCIRHGGLHWPYGSSDGGVRSGGRHHCRAGHCRCNQVGS